MSLKCGIVGLPNVGKSTLFNALTKAGIAAENYPFCTIEPNVGIVELPDPRLDAAGRDRQARARRAGDRRVRRHRRPGGRRQQGRGPGQPVPRATSARPTPSSTWCAASRTTTSSTWPARSTRSPTSRSSRPSCAWPTWPRWRRACTATTKAAKRSGSDKEAQRLVDVLEKCQAALDQAQPVRGIDFSKEELVVLKPLCLITAKPAMFVGNVAEDGFENNPLPRPAARLRRRSRTRRWWRSAPRPRPSWPTWPTRTGCCSCTRWGRTSRA